MRNHPAKREAGERVGCRKRCFKVLAPGIVKIDIDPVRSRSKQGLREVARCFIVDDTVDADVFEERAFCGAARRSDDRVPFDLGDLTRRPILRRRTQPRQTPRRLGFNAAIFNRPTHAVSPVMPAIPSNVCKRQPERFEALEGPGGGVEDLAPAQPTRNQIARP